MKKKNLFFCGMISCAIQVLAIECEVIAPTDSIISRRSPTSKRAELELAKNEAEGFQLRVSGIETNNAVRLRLIRAEEMPFEVESFRLGLFQNRPDVLVPNDENRASYGDRKNRAYFYIRVTTDADCFEGENHFVVEVLSKNQLQGEGVQVPVKVTVRDVILPERTSIPHIFGIFDRAIYGRYRVDPSTEIGAKALMDTYRMLQEYKLSPYFCDWISDSETEVMHETYPSPYPLMDPRTLALVSDEKQAAVAVPFHSLVEEGQYKPLFWMNHKLSEWKQFNHYLKENGLADKAYYYVFDEPHQDKHYPILINWAQELYHLNPDAKVLTTYFSGPDKKPETIYDVPEMIKGHTQIHCLSYWSTKRDENNYKRFHEEVLKSDPTAEQWMYTTRLGFDVRLVNHRALVWKMFKDGAGGYLYWAANPYVFKNTPYEEPQTFSLPGNGYIMILPREIYIESEKDTFIRPDYLSLNKPVSAVGDSSAGHGPEYAVDGDWAHPKCGWWGRGALTVDLEKEEDIGSIQVVPYFRSKRIYSYYVETSLDGTNWVEIVDMRGNKTPGAEEGHTHSLTSPVKGRYVRLTVLGSNVHGGAAICEFIVRAPGQSAVKAEEKYTINTDFTPLGTLRLEAYRDGIEDYELLKIYRDEFGTKNALIKLSAVYTDPKVFTQNHDDIRKLRAALFEDLLE